MENTRKIRGIARDESQRTLTIESLEAVEQLAANFQVRFHSQTHQHKFIDLFRRADGECFRSNAGDRKIGFVRRSPYCAGGLRRPHCGGGLPFPDWQAANRAPLE